jgi:hypothetical protein
MKKTKIQSKIEKADEKESALKTEDTPKDKWDAHSCDYKNEAACEEELDEEGLDKDEEESDHYEEKDEDLRDNEF